MQTQLAVVGACIVVALYWLTAPRAMAGIFRLQQPVLRFARARKRPWSTRVAYELALWPFAVLLTLFVPYSWLIYQFEEWRYRKQRRLERAFAIYFGEAPVRPDVPAVQRLVTERLAHLALAIEEAQKLQLQLWLLPHGDQAVRADYLPLRDQVWWRETKAAFDFEWAHDAARALGFAVLPDWQAYRRHADLALAPA